MTAPIFGSRDIPLQVRSLLCLAVSLLILPGYWHASLAVPHNTLEYMVLVASEVLIGLCLGLGIDILLSGARLAGQMIGMSSGEAMAEMYDPQTDESFAVHSHFLFIVTMLVFVGIGGHRLMLGALLDTLQTIPPGKAGVVGAPLVEVFETLVTQCFSLGIRAAAPTVVALVVSSLVLGLISRTLPQLNVMALGFGLNSMVMYGMLMVSAGAAAMVFQEQLEPALESLVTALAMR
jgi:flagellar biosynthetic protein FliR